MDTEHVIDPNQTEVKINGLKKKSPRKKSPPKLSIKQNLLLEKLKLFYENKSNMNQLLDIINSTSKISLRIIDWFVTNYSKKYYTILQFKDLNGVQKRFKVYQDYKLRLKAYSKKRFDPFCRWDRINLPYKDGTFIQTTLGQLNFFRWALENKVIDYIENNANNINNDMNKRNSTAKNKKKSEGKQTRKKREELSISAAKTIKRENVEIVVKFN